MLFQIDVISVDQWVSETHLYRICHDVLDFSRIEKNLFGYRRASWDKRIWPKALNSGFAIVFMGALSNPEAEHFLQKNTAAKSFCDVLW